ncbi:MAG: penicillin acylase family protein [Candidatus Acidiferrales bacterium]
MPPPIIRRVLRSALLFVLLLLMLAAGGAWWRVHRALPQLDGSAVLPGLSHQIIVDRDNWGIPWIQAASLEDLAMAQGYIEAQDRLWQMDLIRRAAAGDLAEIFGPIPGVLASDRENRTLALRESSLNAVRELDPQSREILEAFSRGVNRYIDERRDRLPVPFALLRYEPRPWTPADTFLVSAYMWKTLTSTWKSKLNRARLTAMVGPERARDLYVVDSPLDHYIVSPLPQGKAAADTIPSHDKLFSEAAPSKPIAQSEEAIAWQQAAVVLGQFDSETTELTGSNNFVVNGTHTYSGKPLLANDTHLALEVPCIWYIVHLTAPGWNVEGFALPGTPLVIIGHNDHIAWGFTNSNADVQDLFAETFNPQNPLEYRVNDHWAKIALWHELIHVKGAPDEPLGVVFTRHGSIVYRETPEEGGRAYALRWTLTQPGGNGFAFPFLGKARNWDEFRDVLKGVTGPGQNTIYADVDGNIGFILPARIPIRKNGNGDLPVPGDTDEFEWTSYIPFDELPQALNPPNGIIATANARNVGPGYKYFLSDRWAGPYRTERLYELLSDRHDLRPADLNAIQNDIVSIPNRFLADELVRASRNHPVKDPATQALIANLANWDGRATAGSAETSFLEFTRHALMHRLLAPFLDGHALDYELWEPDSEYGNIWWRDKVFLENVLRSRSAAWLPKEFTDYDALLAACADDAAAELKKITGSNQITDWQWGTIHTLDMVQPLGRSGILHSLLSFGPYANEGTVDTVKAMGYGHGPAMRFVADLSNFDDSLMEITTGESENYGSEHYRDQFVEWFAGRGISAPFSPSAEAHVRAHRLLLEPAATDSRASR